MRSVSLGQALVEKGREQAAASGHEQAVAVLTEKIGANVENLKKELLAMPPHSTQLSPGARTAYETLEAQLLIIASGFSGCEDYALDAYEALKAAGVPVLQAGDMACGASLVVHAIASGKKAAAEADRRLMGYTNIL